MKVYKDRNCYQCKAQHVDVVEFEIAQYGYAICLDCIKENWSKREIPKFKHDCNGCTYLGGFKDHDLYFCMNGTPGGKHATVIARYGNGAHEYSSGLLFDYSQDCPRLEAMNRAIAKGLLTKKAFEKATGNKWKEG